MVCIVKKKTKFIKQTCLDLWGIHVRYGKLTKALNFIKVIEEQTFEKSKFFSKDFVYSLRRRIHFRSKKEFKNKFILPRILINFYIVLSRRSFRRYAIKAKKHSGLYIENFLGNIEGRLYMMVYRCNYISNLFMIQHHIMYGMFCVNFKIKEQYNFIMKPGDILSFSSISWLKLFKLDFLLKINNNIIMWPVPKYLYSNNIFFFTIYIKYPEQQDILYPVDGIDIQLANDYYYV